MKHALTRTSLIAAAVCCASALHADITVKVRTPWSSSPEMAEVYMANNPSVKIQVTGGGTARLCRAAEPADRPVQRLAPIRPKEIETCIKAFGKRPKDTRSPSTASRFT